MALVREKFGLEREQGLKLADFPTLRHVIGYIARRAGAGDAPVAGPSPGAVATPAAGVAEVQEAVVAIVAAKTGYERELLDLDLDLEADLGIDTIKQAQVMALVREKFGLEREQGLKLADFPTLRHVIGYIARRAVASPVAGPAPVAKPAPVAGPAPGAVATPAAGPAPGPSEVQEAVLAIVAAKTGYERELLDLDLDLEADLGIDTIKQAQVMALVREKFGLEREQGLKLADFPTLRHVIGYIARRAAPGAVATVGAPDTFLCAERTPREVRLELQALARVMNERDVERDYRAADEPPPVERADVTRLDTLAAWIAAKELVAGMTGERPRDVGVRFAPDGTLVATTARHPLTARRLKCATSSAVCRVELAGEPSIDTDRVVAYWRERERWAGWPGEGVLYGFIRQFLAEIEVLDPAAWAPHIGRPVLYLTNHQTGIDGFLVTFALSPVAGKPITTIAMREHNIPGLDDRLGVFFGAPSLRPGLFDELARFFNQKEAIPEDVVRVAHDVEKVLRDGSYSLRVVAAGRRERVAGEPLTRASVIWADVALAAGVPIVPLRVRGGLSRDDQGGRHDFPPGYGKHRIVIGRPILPHELAAIPPRERRAAMLAWVNDLGRPEDDVPSPGDAEFAAGVARWREYSGVDEIPAVMFRCLAGFYPPALELRGGAHAFHSTTSALVAAGELGCELRKSVAVVVPDGPDIGWTKLMFGGLYGKGGIKIFSAAEAVPPADVVVSVGEAVATAGPPAHGISRMVVEAVATSLQPAAAPTAIRRGWSVLVTDDGAGVAAALAALLRARGVRVLVLKDRADDEGTLRCELDDAERVNVAAADIRREIGPVRALIHLPRLAPAAPFDELDEAAWRRALAHDVKGLFLLVKEFRDDLLSFEGRGAVLAAATWMGGTFGLPVAGAAESAAILRRPGDGGVAGLVKTLGQELPGLVVKAIDLEPPADAGAAERIAARILEEIESGDRRVEVGYREGRRFAPRVTPRAPAAASELVLDSSKVIAIVGGARGIGSAIAKELARRHRPTLVLLGTVALPGNIEQLAALDEDGLRALRRELAREIEAGGARATPVAVQSRFERIRGAVEAYRNLRELSALGAQVSYHVCDVRDAEATRGVFAEILRRHRTIDGLVFGAGIIEDKLLQDKKPESFDRVFGVKAEGVFNVLRALAGVDLEFLAVFSSVAGRFGNRGQCDYAAANDLLSKVVLAARAGRPRTRCFAIDWTVWGGVGLAARSGVAEVMRESGFEVLPAATGAAMFCDEVVRGGDAPEIVIAGGVGPIDRDGIVARAPQAEPEPASAVPGPPAAAPDRLRHPVIEEVLEYRPGVSLLAQRTVDPARDPWILDHVIGGVPLLPGVVAVELMAEAAGLLYPDWHFAGVRDLRFHLAVKILKDRPVALRVRARSLDAPGGHQRAVAVRVESDFTSEAGVVLVRDRLHYEGLVLLAPRPPDPLRALPRPAPAGAGEVTSGAAIYGAGAMLPHGPRFRVLSELRMFEGTGAVGIVAPLDEAVALAIPAGGALATAPLAREAAFQTAGLWEAFQRGRFGVPHGCRSLEHFGRPPAGVGLVAAATPVRGPSGEIEHRIELVGEDGLVYDRMDSFTTVQIDSL